MFFSAMCYLRCGVHPCSSRSLLFIGSSCQGKLQRAYIYKFLFKTLVLHGFAHCYLAVVISVLQYALVQITQENFTVCNIHALLPFTTSLMFLLVNLRFLTIICRLPLLKGIFLDSNLHANYSLCFM